MLGAVGDKLAKELGHADGAMPMHAWLPGDIEPCDECKERGIAIVEVEDDKESLTGSRWLVSERAVKDMLEGSDILTSVIEHRLFLIGRSTAESLGLHGIDSKERPEGDYAC